MFDVTNLVADAMRDLERRDGLHLESGGLSFNASFILGSQIAGEEMRLLRINFEGNFIECGTDTSFLQTGETKYGKPILDLAVTSSANLEDDIKCGSCPMTPRCPATSRSVCRSTCCAAPETA